MIVKSAGRRPAEPQAGAGESVARSAAIMAQLRSPDGCPWDREQTFDSIKPHTLEEVYEVFDAIDRRDWNALRDELGDLLLQVLFYSQMAEEAGYFSLSDVAATLNAKLIRRHPHVFSDATAETAEDVTQTWNRIKQAEKEKAGDLKQTRLLDSVPEYLTALLEAKKLGQRAASVGFDWPDVHGLFSKLQEEIAELEAELTPAEPDDDRVADELGDLLFTVVHLARQLRQEPEFVLRKANRKFRQRFNRMEELAGGTESLQNAEPDDLERLWQEVKREAAG